MEGHPAALLLPLCAFAACCGVPRLQALISAALRPSLLPYVHAGVFTVAWLQERCQSGLVTAVAEAAAHTVSVPFYAVSLPVLFWVRASRCPVEIFFVIYLPTCDNGALHIRTTLPVPI